MNGQRTNDMIVFLVLSVLCAVPTRADETVARDAAGRIVIEAHTELPKPADFYAATAKARVNVDSDFITQTIALSARIIQGDANTLRFGLNGNGRVTEVVSDKVKAWSVRQEGAQRFLEIHPADDTERLDATIKIRSERLELPTTRPLTHLTPGKAVGFDTIITLEHAVDMDVSVTKIEGFVPLGDPNHAKQFQTATGGVIQLELNRDRAAPGPIELTDTSLTGDLHETGNSMTFELSGTALVTEPGAAITILSGNAAANQVPAEDAYRLRLASTNDHPSYELVFSEAGKHRFSLVFVAALGARQSELRTVDFTVAAGAVVPVTLKGLDKDLEFQGDANSMMPRRTGANWVGFLPASGRAHMQWKIARRTGEGKLFFSTTGQIEAMVGAGLLRQLHQIDYQVLQGQLTSVSMALHGPGEVLDLRGPNVVAWKVTGDDDARQLDVTLSQPIEANSRITVLSQTPLGAFPVRVDGLRLDPVGAFRHSGHLRLTNSGAVRVEPTALQGLTQLAPEQFPGKPTNARQSFVYRFPLADHTYTIIADRIQPEVHVAQLIRYELDETDRVIRADVELDIREAPSREWDFGIPADYSVVSVTGAAVSDYVVSTQADEGRRNLKVIFGEDVAGRQLVSLHLEKNETAAAGDWQLPRIDCPAAKTVRGDIGIIGAPGFRVAVKETNRLLEKPVSHFPKPSPNLQQAFRIRDPDWSATLTIQRLEGSVQADVFHLYSLSQETIYGSALVNYFVAGAPVSEWRLTVPQSLGNVMVDGQDVRTWRREDDTLIISLHQPVMGSYTLLVTFEEKPNSAERSFRVGQIEPLVVNGERGFIQIVSPQQVEIATLTASDGLLPLEAIELPAEFRLLRTAPSLGTWQYTERPFDLSLQVNWFDPGKTVPQVVEFSEAKSRVSQDGELVTDILYYVKTRGQRSLRIELPGAPVRLWEASVNGQPVTARQTDDATLIPLPGGVDTNVPVEVRLRLGKPSVSRSRAELELPVVHAPVLKTQWNIEGDERRVLIPRRGTVTSPAPVLPPSGIDWVAKRGIFPMLWIGVLTAIGGWATGHTRRWQPLGLIALLGAVGMACFSAISALSQMSSPAPLQLSLPILAAGERAELIVSNTPLWRVNFSTAGIMIALLGVAAVVWSYLSYASKEGTERYRISARAGGAFLIALGVLFHRDGAPGFFALLATSIFCLLLLPRAWAWARELPATLRHTAREGGAEATGLSGEDSGQGPSAGDEPGGGAIVTTLLFIAVGLLTFTDRSYAAESEPSVFAAGDSIQQTWKITHEDRRLNATGTMTLTAEPGDQFLLLRGPAVLTRFEGQGLRLTKEEVPGCGLAYIVTVPRADVDPAAEVSAIGDDDDESKATWLDASAMNAKAYTVTFDYQLDAVQPMNGIAVLTGLAAVQQIDLRYDEIGWEVRSPNAVRIQPIDDTNATRALILIGLGKSGNKAVLNRPPAAQTQRQSEPKHAAPSLIILKPQSRDVTVEDTKFFVEASNLYLPGPGVVDGRHRLHIRTSQGQVSELTAQVPPGLTVSAVSGPIGAWKFDADSGRLQIEIEPAQSSSFDVDIETQRGLDPLPVNVELAPMTVADANGQVGSLAIAFGPDAQPEATKPQRLSAVSLGDFNAELLPSKDAKLHRVYRYGADGGELDLRVSAVAPEIRVVSQQVLSLGDERVVLGVNFAADIMRAGLFQLSFVLPTGLEVESLTGAALHHWSELTENNQRKIILHLNGKTVGTQQFSLTLAGPVPATHESWNIPRFQLEEASRQTGELVVRPTTGIRLRTISRRNVSETDPRSVGGNGQGVLAFRLLQRDWQLELGIEKLEPWVTGQVLHEVTLREGQTRSALLASFDVQNASIRALQVALPLTNPDEIRTLRTTGHIVSDFARTAPDSNVWEVQFKRRVVGKVDFRIEFERRGDRENDAETLVAVGFPQARQLSYYGSIRSGGRLEVETDENTPGWQQIDWNTVPQALREAGNRTAPAIAVRSIAPVQALTIKAKRHSVADALKLRVTKGELTTVLSPNGDQLTAVDVTMDVLQRSSLSVGLPAGGELFSIFVNGESVNSIRKGGTENTWQFYILPGIDDRTATVRFVFAVRGDQLKYLKLSSPRLNVPLENIEWNVVAPKGFELSSHDGNLELVRRKQTEDYDRSSYLSKVSGRRQAQAQQAAHLLEQANQLLQAGEQTKARWALNSVANQYALDAASNEDARVQLENLQTQQAIVGLNTRRQRLYLDNDASKVAVIENQQLREAAAANPLLQQDQLNFRPQQLSQLLRGNTTEDNEVLQRIAARLVQHQRTTEPAPQAIIISLPEEGTVYNFRRSVQVADDVPLELDLSFHSPRRTRPWQTGLALMLLAAIVVGIAFAPSQKPTPISDEASAA